ncbi:hypothetical protein MHYP_G00242970 [Metynnis hypsauchen]
MDVIKTTAASQDLKHAGLQLGSDLKLSFRLLEPKLQLSESELRSRLLRSNLHVSTARRSFREPDHGVKDPQSEPTASRGTVSARLANVTRLCRLSRLQHRKGVFTGLAYRSARALPHRVRANGHRGRSFRCVSAATTACRAAKSPSVTPLAGGDADGSRLPSVRFSPL